MVEVRRCGVKRGGVEGLTSTCVLTCGKGTKCDTPDNDLEETILVRGIPPSKD